jgi:hypothetical protein
VSLNIQHHFLLLAAAMRAVYDKRIDCERIKAQTRVRSCVYALLFLCDIELELIEDYMMVFMTQIIFDNLALPVETKVAYVCLVCALLCSLTLLLKSALQMNLAAGWGVAQRQTPEGVGAPTDTTLCMPRRVYLCLGIVVAPLLGNATS